MDMNKKSLLREMGQRYFERRRALGFTQEDAAEIADVTQQAISDAELGKSFLSPDSMLKLCKAYGVSSDYILTGEISDRETLLIDKRIRDLPPDTFFHYERMTDHFLAAVKGGGTVSGDKNRS